MKATLPYVSRKVRELREAQQLSCSELARRTGMCFSSVWRIENGRLPRVTFNSIRRIAEALGVSLGEFDE